MGKINPHGQVKVITGLLSLDAGMFDAARPRLARRFGPIDAESEIFNFNQTDYYELEMGRNLKRKFFSFSRLIRPDSAEKLKIFTNRLEARFAEKGRRLVNIDPGYVSAEKLVLLTTKNHSHRIYLGSGIYAQIELYFKNGGFHPWPWTYPDYKTEGYRNFFAQVRSSL